MISQRSVVSRILPQRSVASRTLPQRSIVSRQQPGQSCGCRFGLSDGYLWQDILDKTFTLTVPVPAYNHPGPNNIFLLYLQPGDQVYIYSFVNSGGSTWLACYLVKYGIVNTGRLYFLKTSGPAAGSYSVNTGTIGSIINPKADDSTIMTEAEQAAADQQPIDKLLAGLKWGAIVVAVGLIGSKLLKK
jgi:hypothetical protein